MSLAATLAKVAGVRTVFQPEAWHDFPCAAADLAGLSPLAFWQEVHRVNEGGLPVHANGPQAWPRKKS